MRADEPHFGVQTFDPGTRVGDMQATERSTSDTTTRGNGGNDDERRAGGDDDLSRVGYKMGLMRTRPARAHAHVKFTGIHVRGGAEVEDRGKLPSGCATSINFGSSSTESTCTPRPWCPPSFHRRVHMAPAPRSRSRCSPAKMQIISRAGARRAGADQRGL